jgi:hypothetical protein
MTAGGLVGGGFGLSTGAAVSDVTTLPDSLATTSAAVGRFFAMLTT